MSNPRQPSNTKKTTDNQSNDCDWIRFLSAFASGCSWKSANAAAGVLPLPPKNESDENKNQHRK